MGLLHFNALAGGDPCEYPDKLCKTYQHDGMDKSQTRPSEVPVARLLPSLSSDNLPHLQNSQH